MSVVKMYLPRAPGFAQPLAEDPSEGGDEAILIVEDDDLVRRYVVAQIQSLGYRTLVAGNAGEALTIIGNDEKIDLLFTDVVFLVRSMDGSWPLKHCIAGPRSRYCIRRATRKSTCLATGDTDVLLLAKPYRMVDLAKMIRAALAA
jgi:CheY-like chemotaxis protein